MRPAAGSLLLAISLVSVAAGEGDPRFLIETGRFKQARAALEPRVQANPSDAAAAAMLSQVRVAFGDYEAGVALAEMAVRLDGRVAEYHWRLARACGEQARGAGMMKQFGLAKRFRQEAEAALALDPKMIEPRLYLISYYAGLPAIAGGDDKKAAQIADDVARIDPAWGSVARARIVEESDTAADKKETAERAALYEKALQAARTTDARSEALAALVGIYLTPALQDFDRAEQYAREGVKNAPDRALPYAGLAMAYASSAKWAELDAALAEAEKAVADNLAPYYQAGRVILVRGGDPARAERYFRKFLTQDPEPGPVTTAHAHWRLGLTLEKQGKRADAVSEIEIATRMKPDFEPAKKDLRRLQGK